MSFEEEKKLEQEYVMPTFARYDVEFVSGNGMHLQDSDGKDYLDFLSGIGVCSLGHCNPIVVDAISGQAAKLIHVSNYFYIEGRGEVARLLSNMANADCDEPYVWKTFFANSGAEANECAIKLARLHANILQGDGEAPRKSKIVTLRKSFHGRTLATLAATAQERLHEGFYPLPQDFIDADINDVAALEQLFESQGESICAMMFECIQGESGVNPCTPEFLQAARRLTEECGALLICDEVQTGVYRTGKPFAFQHFGILPDVITVAKGIASGIPAGACLARSEFADEMTAGKHGSTFGGSNIAVSAALATLTELSKPSYSEQITATGEYLRESLSQLEKVVEVRGLGLMCGVDIDASIDAHDVAKKALDLGLVINAPGDHTLRFLPPLICNDQDVDEFISRLRQALE